MQTEQSTTTYPQKIARILLKIILFLLLFIIVVALLLLTPPVQKFVTGRVEVFLENKLQTRVDIGSIAIGLPRKIVLKDFYIEDKTRDTLLSGERLGVNIDIFKIFANEFLIKDIQAEGVTAKIKRILPDTAFNFQFIVDAFAVQSTQPDTAAAALVLDIDDVAINNSRIIYKDVITGNDMLFAIGNLATSIDTFNINTSHYEIKTLDVKDLTAVINQTKPLVQPEPLAKDLAEAATPPAMKLNFDKVNLDNVNVDYNNVASALFTRFNIDEMVVDGRDLDLENQQIHLDELRLNNTASVIRLGKTAAAKDVEEEVEKEITVQKQQPWNIRVDNIIINNNSLTFDNDNTPKQRTGMDFAHLKADSLTLHLKDFVMNTDSIAAVVTKGMFTEKSGFQLDALQGELLYANNQSYLKNLYLKTPGTVLRRDAVLQYASYDALVNNFEATIMDIDLVNSQVQVKDILAFAPQLRSHPAFANPNAIWRFHIQGSGNMDRLHFESLQFSGLRNTEIDAYGTLAGLNNPNQAGGTFTIRKLNTNQTDISLFTGTRLSTPDVNVPESFAINGTLSGNMSNLTTNLNVNTSAGFAAVNGRFTNLTTPASTTYNATVRTSNLQLGSILKNPSLGNVSANVTLNGRGLTPDAINTRFKGNVYAIGLNNYTYRNIAVTGSLQKTVFSVNADIKDPNAFLTAKVNGNFSKSPSFTIDAFVDSLKTLPLNLTTEPLTFRGKIDGSVTSLDPSFLQANIVVTNSLLVSGKDRLEMDTLHFIADRSDTATQYISLQSDIANAFIEGNFRFTDLGAIFMHNIDPYFSIVPGKTKPTSRPYDLTFRIDVASSPFITTFVPGLVVSEPLHIDGSLANDRGLQGNITSPLLTFQNNKFQNLNVQVTTTPAGLQLTGNLDRLIGSGFNLYTTRINATALNDVINFEVGIDDKAARNKYHLNGIFTQPSTGTYAVQVRPDSLLLNYDPWTIAPNNQLVISPNAITANNFTLQQGTQQLSLQSSPGAGTQPLNVTFTNFQLSTITGFIQSDTLLANGNMNGTVTFNNLPKQPLFTSNLSITDLSMKQDTIGNVQLQVSNTVANRYDADVTLSGRGNDARITGSITQLANDLGLNLNVDLRQLQLRTLQGAMAGFVTSASGAINGDISINGTSSQPRVQGTLNFDTTTISTTLLGGPLTIDRESLTVTENGFRFDNFTIRDSARNALNIDGNVTTSNFINYGFNLDVDADNFRVLNTTSKDNKIYYGQLTVSTNLHIGGTEVLPIVDGAVTVGEGTNFTIVIPQPEPGVTEREGVVEFVNFNTPENDSLFLAYDSLNVSNIVGFDISANIEILKEARFNVIIDVANGDLLNLQGTGQLSTGIDPSGKITLTGTYEIEKGGYQFSFNFLRRDFVIEKGSKITWLGEPTAAELDVTAIYEVNTSPLDLVADQVATEQRNYYLQKLPFQIYLQMDGELMKPVLTFDIRLPEGQNYNVGGDIISNVNTRLTQLRQQPSELNKQVFAVLLLNRFVGENPFQSGAGGGMNAGSFARQSVSKLMTEQLNQLAGGLIDGVDLNFDVASSDDYTTGERRSRTDLNVGLSKRLLNDRLTVTVGSNFQLEGPQPANQSGNNIAGNVAVNYQLSKDGRYMLRFYRRNEYEGQVDGYIIETGLGFIITVDYNRFRDIIEGRRVKRQLRKEEKNQNQEQ